MAICPFSNFVLGYWSCILTTSCWIWQVIDGLHKAAFRFLWGSGYRQ